MLRRCSWVLMGTSSPRLTPFPPTRFLHGFPGFDCFARSDDGQMVCPPRNEFISGFKRGICDTNGMKRLLLLLPFLLAAQPAKAQRDPNHCDSMVRAAMQGYQISKDAPCIDVNEGDWPKSAKYYSKFEYFCIGRERNPGCS